MADIGQNLEIWAGYDWEIDVDIFDDDQVTPMPMTGLSLQWFLASVYDRSRTIIEKTSTAGGIVISDPGAATIILNDTDTSVLGGQPYYHELAVIDAAGTVKPVLSGSVTIKKSILAASMTS